MKSDRIRQTLIENIDDLDAEYKRVIVGDPYPQVSGIQNKTKRDTLILALSQVSLDEEED